MNSRSLKELPLALSLLSDLYELKEMNEQSMDCLARALELALTDIGIDETVIPLDFKNLG